MYKGSRSLVLLLHRTEDPRRLEAASNGFIVSLGFVSTPGLVFLAQETRFAHSVKCRGRAEDAAAVGCHVRRPTHVAGLHNAGHALAYVEYDKRT
jgi:hypothetical protein